MKTISKHCDREIPVVAECDVLVIGAGPGGVSAAVTAARNGAKVVLADLHGAPGGTATFGEITPMMPNHYSPDGVKEHTRPLDGPLYLDIMKRMNSYLPPAIRRSEFGSYVGVDYIVDKNLISLAMEDLCLEAGVKMLYHFDLAEVVRDGRRITHALFQTKSGLLAVAARNFIDSTGDGDLAALAGCEFEFGEKASGYCQPMTLCFKLCHVDRERVDWPAMQAAYKEAQRTGRLHCPRENILTFRFYDDDIVHFNTTRVVKKSAVNALERSEAEIEGRRQMREIVDWLRAEIPGFENARYLSVAAEIGVRESRRILGRGYLTQEDFVRHAAFPDGVVRCNYNIDIHSPVGEGTSFVRCTLAEFYEIPYGCLLPRDVDNLAVGCRAISVSHELHASSRVMPPVCSTGQAAGMAAAMAAKRGIDLAAVDGVELRGELRKFGANL